MSSDECFVLTANIARYHEPLSANLDDAKRAVLNQLFEEAELTSGRWVG
jgi:hypothetical protein